MTMKIAVLPGDGIGPEIVKQALRVLDEKTKAWKWNSQKRH